MANVLEANTARLGKIRANTLFKGINVVIATSYQQDNWDLLREASAALEAGGFACYPPSRVNPQILEDGFVLMSEKPVGNKRDKIQRAFFEKGIANAKFLYVLPAQKEGNGYIGRTVAHEVGYAMLHNKPIVLASPIHNFAPIVPERLAAIITREMKRFLVISPEDIKGKNRRGSMLRTLPDTVNFDLSDEEKVFFIKEIENLLSDFAKGKY